MKLTADDFRRQYADLSDEALLDIDPDDLNETARACYFEETASRGMGTPETAATPAGKPSRDAREYVRAGTMETGQDAKGVCERLQRHYIPAHVAADGRSVMVPPAVLHEAQDVIEGWMPGELYEEAAASSGYVRHSMGAVRAVVYGEPGLVDFAQEVFGAVELERCGQGDGSSRVEMAIGDSVVVLVVGEGEANGGPCTVHVYVPDVDAAFGRALENGATEVQAPEDLPLNERVGVVTDQSGNIWFLATYHN
ncbi:MAG: hypothetical protein ABI759_10785 [Candidatus Solibacter sp.]